VDLGFPYKLSPFPTVSGHCLTIYYSYYIEALFNLVLPSVAWSSYFLVSSSNCCDFLWHYLVFQSFNMTILSSSVDFFLQYFPLKHTFYFGCSYYPNVSNGSLHFHYNISFKYCERFRFLCGRCPSFWHINQHASY
jgi:hypothetical protein